MQLVYVDDKGELFVNGRYCQKKTSFFPFVDLRVGFLPSEQLTETAHSAEIFERIEAVGGPMRIAATIDNNNSNENKPLPVALWNDVDEILLK